MSIPTFFDREFWRLRIINAISSGDIRICLYNASRSVWDLIQKESRDIIKKHVRNDEYVLDVGCGIGLLLDCISIPTNYYIGLDISPDLIALAKIYHPEYTFEIGDCQNIKYEDKHFDWVIVRGVIGSINEAFGKEVLDRCLLEMKRVAKKVLILNLSLTNTFEVLSDET